MSALPCGREDELLGALGRGFVGRELEAHTVACPSCRELHLVAQALLADREVASTEAAIPAAGTMWWRMRIRQRQEVAARARRSLLVGQAATLAVALGLVALLFGDELAGGLRHLAAGVPVGTPLLVAIAVSALLAPLAGWLALRRE